MIQRVRFVILALSCPATEAWAEPWGRWHEQAKHEHPQAEKNQAQQGQGTWKCETGAWSMDRTGKFFKAEEAVNGPYDKDGNPTGMPTDHGAFSVIAFARPGATLVNGSCFIGSREAPDYAFPGGVAISPLPGRP
jgi:hypothetical protein